MLLVKLHTEAAQFRNMVRAKKFRQVGFASGKCERQFVEPGKVWAIRQSSAVVENIAKVSFPNGGDGEQLIGVLEEVLRAALHPVQEATAKTTGHIPIFLDPGPFR